MVVVVFRSRTKPGIETDGRVASSSRSTAQRQGALVQRIPNHRLRRSAGLLLTKTMRHSHSQPLPGEI
jgi:hypothetical protein